MRSGFRPVIVLAALACMVSAPFPTEPFASPAIVSLPVDFPSRYMNVCRLRGRSEAYCACMMSVVLREVADEHLALMLDYLENPANFDSRAMQELDNDDTRMAILADEIAAAQEATRNECTP